MEFIRASFVAACALLCAACTSVSKKTYGNVNLSKRYHAGNARIVLHDNSGRFKMHSANEKPAPLVKKAKITHVANKKAVIKKKNPKAAEKLDPETVGPEKVTMQDYNRYAYRKSDSGKPGVPVTKAADGEADKDEKK
jgi:hypothetical protein